MRSDVEHAAVATVSNRPWTELPLHAWEALPLPIRVQHRLAEILMLADDLRAEFRDSEGASLRWVDSEVERITESVESLLDHLAC